MIGDLINTILSGRNAFNHHDEIDRERPLRKTQNTSIDLDDGVLYLEESHLPLTRANIKAILNNPRITFRDCDALYFSLLNGDPGLYCEYSDAVLRRQAGLVTDGGG